MNQCNGLSFWKKVSLFYEFLGYFVFDAAKILGNRRRHGFAHVFLVQSLCQRIDWQNCGIWKGSIFEVFKASVFTKFCDIKNSGLNLSVFYWKLTRNAYYWANRQWFFQKGPVECNQGRRCSVIADYYFQAFHFTIAKPFVAYDLCNGMNVSPLKRCDWVFVPPVFIGSWIELKKVCNCKDV